MRVYSLINRNFKEIIRDPLTLIFAILLPIFLLFIFQQFDIPAKEYALLSFAPSIVIFGQSFLTLFTANLISKDRTTSLLSRLFVSPLKPYQYILGYILAIFPIALIQSILFFFVAILLGLPFTFNIIVSLILSIPLSILFISFGILVGSIFNDKASPGIGSILVQLVCFTSGMYFDVSNVGGILKFLSEVLPFSYCVDIMRAAVSGNLLNQGFDFIIVLIYITVLVIISSFVFKRKMLSDNK